MFIVIYDNFLLSFMIMFYEYTERCENMKKNFKLEITADMIEDLKTYKTEIDTMTYVIDNLFEIHKDDNDYSFFESVPFKSYQKELYEYKIKYDKAIEEFNSKLIPIVQEHLGKNKVNFEWYIEDFSKLEIDIYMK